MKLNFTKTIFIIVFVVFLGTEKVNAEICSYRQDTSRQYNDVYIIKLDVDGSVESIVYREIKISNEEIKKEEDRTGEMTVNFTSCPSTISVTGNSITSGGTFQISTNLGGNSSGSSANLSASTLTTANLDPGIGSLEPSTNTTYCGTLTDIPTVIPATTSLIYTLIQILVPLILIIFGMLDLAKAITAQKEDEIKKGQQTLIKRIIAAMIVFLVFAVVKMAVSFFSDSATVVECMDCFIKNNCGI